MGTEDLEIDVQTENEGRRRIGGVQGRERRER